MKVYISADIEGVAGITHWDEAFKDRRGYAEYREQMTAETVAACEGAPAALENPSLADCFEIEVWYKENTDAYAASHYPGARLHAPHCVAYETGDFFEIMRMLQFVHP